MSDETNASDRFEDLRRRAEELLQLNPQTLRQLPSVDVQQLIHELQVYQTELEMQNAELRQAQHELAASRDLYFSFYDLAPVGYLTVTAKGMILRTNLNFATLLGVDRQDLVGKPLSRFVLPDDHDVFYRHLGHLRKALDPSTFDLRMVKRDGTPFHAHLVCGIDQDSADEALFPVTVIDISERVRTEQALRQAEFEKAMILNSANEMFAYHDIDLRVRWANAASARAVGQRMEDLVGRHCYEIWYDRDVPCDGCPALLCHQTKQPQEAEMRTPDGRIYLLRVYPVMDEDGNLQGFAELSQDITERRKAEEALRASEARYRSYVDHAPSGVFIADERGRYLEVNDAAARITGFSKDELMGMSIPDLLPPEAQEATQGHFSRLAETGQSYAEVPFVRKDGTVGYWAVDTVKLSDDRFLGFATDITERKLAEELLRQNERLLRMVADNYPNSYVSVVDRDLTLAFSGGQEFAKRALPSSVLDGLSVDDVFKPYGDDIAETVKDNYLRTFEGQESTFELFMGGQHQLYRTTPLPDEQGNIERILVVVENITERKQMEAELLRAQKLESVGLLAGGIAHDFNNLLTTILGNVSLAKRKLQRARRKDVVEMLTDAEAASRRATALTKQLLAFAKGGAPVKTTVSIANLLRESASFALRGSPARCRLDIAEDLWPVDVDEGQISQAITNLLINAWQAMPAGGVVTLSAQNRVVSMPMPGLAAGRHVTISVEDEGIGIPADLLSRIFDPYFTTKEKGRGLGLSSTHAIITKHGGHISVESTVGQGTTFHIDLPASSAEIATAQVETTELVRGQGRVLVMDDEDAVRALPVRVLRAAGYQVEPAADGAEAIELYRQAHASGSSFDVVILDLTVAGGMGGVEAIRELRQIDPQVKAIVSSGYSTDAVMADFGGHGFAGVIPKPYEPEQLSQVVHDVIHQRTT